jgi:hypothetical protein
VQFREASAAAAANAAETTSSSNGNDEVVADVLIKSNESLAESNATSLPLESQQIETLEAQSTLIAPQPEDRNPPSENFDLADDSFIKEDPAGDDADSIGPDHHESWSAAKGEDTYDDKEEF